MKRKSTAKVQYKLRIREDLRRRIESAAQKNGVSNNREMIHRLEKSFEIGTLYTLSMIAAEFDDVLAHYRKALEDK